MSEKKRKRQSEKGERPAKKVAIDLPASTVKVSFLVDNDVLGPVIASTPGLSFPTDIPLKPYKKGAKDNRILPPGHKPAPYEVLLQSSAHPKLDYLAREEHDGSADSLLKHYVGVYDPNSGELKLIEAHKVVVRSTLRSELEELRQERERAAQAKRPTMSSKRQELGMEFGTKKSKKAIADLTENAIAPRKPGADTANENGPPVENSVATALLDSLAASTVDMPSREEHQAAVDDSKPRPKPNMQATIPAEVYPTSTIIGNEIMAALNVKDWIDAVAEKREVKLHSRFVAKRLQEVAQSGDVKRLKVLRYILLLINFNAALKTGKYGKGKVLLPKDRLQQKLDVSGSLIDGLKRKFVPASGELTRWHIDNLMAHVAAAALIVDNYEVDVFDLREDLRLETKTIKQYFAEIGCRINPPTEVERSKLRITKAEAINHQVAKLKIPLQFPKQRVIVNKRR